MAFQDNAVSWDDVWHGIQTGAQFITRVGGQAQNVGSQVSNVGNNLQNATSWRLDGKTVVVGALVAGALVYALRRR